MEYMYPCYKDITVTSVHNEPEEQVGDMQCQQRQQQQQCLCGDASEVEVAYYEGVKFWLEAVAVPSVGCVGLICNVAAIPVLLSR